MILKYLSLIVSLSILSRLRCLDDDLQLEIQGIEPNSGPLFGRTRVIVRIKDLNEKLRETYPKPTCKFGSKKNNVEATYVKCLSRPRLVGEKEPTSKEMNQTCIQCEISPSSPVPDIVPLSVSLIGDFTDTVNSLPFRYYKEPIIHWIYPRYGTKNGGTPVEVYGENFLNFDQNLKCGFGNSEVKAHYISRNKLLCYAPPSAVVQKKMPFSISLNNQQNTKQEIYFIYYDQPQVSYLVPNRGPDYGGTVVHIKGQNFHPTKETSFHNYNDTFCRFGNLSINVAKIVSSTEMICNSPPSYELRKVPVEITLNNREWTDDGVLFYYYHPPFVYSIDPRIGPVKGGSEVLVTGSNFVNTGIVLCKFGSIVTKGTYLNENELKCVAPKVEKPGYVKLAIAIREDEFSSGMNTKYLYYKTPIIDRIEPMCGPERGYTQISVFGKNFADTGSDYIKCVFDGKIFMNATRISDNEIKCDSPSVLNYKEINENNITEYDFQITLNARDLNGPTQKFYYYKETFISSISPIYGPVTGKTTVKITGGVFNQTNACNVTVRFSTYPAKPINYTSDTLYVKSPESNFTGAVVVQIALNGKQYDKDIKVNFRDKENSFYYFKWPFITQVKPAKGPTIGGTSVKVFGMNFENVFFNEPSKSKHLIYYRFVECDDPNLTPLGGKAFETLVTSNHFIGLETPKVYKNGTIACIELSYNQENYFRISEYKFVYFSMANITAINPPYGPLKSPDFKLILVTFDNLYIADINNNIICRFKSKTSVFFEKGIYMGPNKVNCTLPRVNIPDVFNVEVSFNNGDEFTNNGFNFTFYDPYVIKVLPSMITSQGGSRVMIHGYGFANSGKGNLKVRFGSAERTLLCGGSKCVVDAEFVNENLIIATSFPKEIVTYRDSGKNIFYDRFAVEVSVYNDDFTNNNITIFYYDEPEVIPNVWAASVIMETKLKELLSEFTVTSLPANSDTFIVVPVDSGNILSSLKSIEAYAIFTCKFENKNDKNIFKITDGLLTSIPVKDAKFNVFLCQSPRWENIGDFKVMISLNSHDFSIKYWSITLTDPIKIFKIEPRSGPVQGGTKLKIYGSGFKNTQEFLIKFGVQNLIPLSSGVNFGFAKESDISPTFKSQFNITKIEITVPTAPEFLATYGGLDYISIGRKNVYPVPDLISRYSPFDFFHTNIEYYYYKPQVIYGISPHGSIVTGGSEILVVGAWFGYKNQYGYRPYCKFGDIIVEGRWLSTVRITCKTPEYPKANVRVPFEVSLNGYDFTSSGFQFTFYNDFNQAQFEYIEPTSGPEIGGTGVNLFGKNFTNMLNPEEFLCRFYPNNTQLQPKSVPAIYKEYEDGRTAIICNTPGGWKSGTVANIQITFDGQTYRDTGFKFYFYKVEKVIPMSGPTTGNGPIQVIGAGFQNSTKVKCVLNQTTRFPLSIREKLIKCEMPPASSNNFTGLIDFSMSLNGIDTKEFSGFYYYIQPNITDIYPKTGPNIGNAIVKVFGSGFRNDFPGVELGCRVGDAYGTGELVSDQEMICHFTHIYIDTRNVPLNFSIALNNYSFTADNENLTFIPYGIMSIDPSSGPISGGTEILVTGAGFTDSKNIRCQFGVQGFYQYTFAKYIDYNHIVCSSPENYVLPSAGSLPFSVPFSISFNEDEYNPWTESTHIFSFYQSPELKEISPNHGKTSETKEVFVMSTLENPFSTPSAIILEQDLVDYSKNGKKNFISKKTISYQPIKCRFGRFGTTSAIYLNRTYIKCITPKIEDDSDISLEDVNVGIALNGVDFVENSEIIYTFEGPNEGRMMWIYILVTLFIAALIALLVYFASSYWDKIQRSLIDTSRRDVYSSDQPHVVAGKPRYLDPQYFQEVNQNP